MPYARVKPGVRHGNKDQYGPGDLIIVSEQELIDFADKIERAPTPGQKDRVSPAVSYKTEGEADPDITSMRIADIIGMVQDRSITSASAMEQELAKTRPRTSLLDKLEALKEQGY